MEELPQAEPLAAVARFGKALSDPIRVKMLRMLAMGRGCCGRDVLVDAGPDAPDGLCICEFEAEFGMIQSRVSYHMKALKDAGMVREVSRGRYLFYLLNREALADGVELLQRELVDAAPVPAADVQGGGDNGR